MSYFNIDEKQKATILAEINRYMFHIFLVYAFSQILEGNYYIFDEHILKTLLTVILAILVYNIFFKKIMTKKLKKINKHFEE